MDNTLDNTFESANRVYGVNGICPTIPTCGGGGIQPKIIEVCKLKKGENHLENVSEQFNKFIYEIDGELYLIRIRKLTPHECWRLMGFTDEDYEKAATVNSNTQLYKQAGNSIVKPVLENLFRQLLPKKRMDLLKLKSLALLG